MIYLVLWMAWFPISNIGHLENIGSPSYADIPNVDTTYDVVVLVQLLSLIFCDPVDCSMPGFPVFHYFQSLLKFISIESVMPSNYLIFCLPLLFLPSVFPNIRVFSKESAVPIRWPKYWSFSFSISPSNEYSGLISFRTDWFDILAFQGTLKSHLQHHNSKASILQHSAFFMVQLSHPYMTPYDTILKTVYLIRKDLE